MICALSLSGITKYILQYKNTASERYRTSYFGDDCSCIGDRIIFHHNSLDVRSMVQDVVSKEALNRSALQVGELGVCVCMMGGDVTAEFDVR